MPFVSVLCIWPLGCISFTEPRWHCRRTETDSDEIIQMTLRIEKSVRQGFTVFTLSGRMDVEQVAELKELFGSDYRSTILDLREMRLADRDAVKFLKSCEREGMKLENCPAYVREWMDKEED
jgi:hypothetical protein